MFVNETSHEERMIEGIAQEFFFQDSEINFYDSRSWDWFYRWAEINGGGFQPGQSVVEYFALKQLGWAGVRCDHTGCSNMVSFSRSPLTVKTYICMHCNSWSALLSLLTKHTLAKL